LQPLSFCLPGDIFEEDYMRRNQTASIAAMVLIAALAISVRLAAQENQDHHRRTHYRLIDVGTFGGPGSGLFEAQRMFTKDGTLVGWADTAIPDPYAPNCLNRDCLIEHGFRWKHGVMTDLGALSGVNNSQAEAINDRGLIIGQSENGLIDPYLNIPATDVVAWVNDEMFNLGTLGGYQGLALAVNHDGQAAGVSTNTVPDQYSFLGPGETQSRAFLWEDGTMQDLGTLGGPDAFGQFINDRGQIAGFSYIGSTAGPLGVPPVDPFLWDKNRGMKDLGNFGGTACNPFYLNNRGELVGNMDIAGDQAAHPFLWNGEKLIDLGTFGGSLGSASWVNEAGDAVGFAVFPNEFTTHAALWPQEKKIKDLGTVAGDNCSFAWDINERGQAVGLSFAEKGSCNYPSPTITVQRAVLWDNGSIIDLNTQIARDSGLRLVLAQQINDRGEIAGVGVPPGVPLSDFEFHSHAFVLIPCNENNSDGQGCEDAESAGVAAQNSSPSLPQNQTTPTQSRPSASERMAAIRSRLARRYPYRNFRGLPPR
jgi:uncharacterized membrane protein